MQMAQHLGVSQGYKQDGVSQVQQRGVSMIMSSDSGGVPYSHVVPQLATLQIGSSVRVHRLKYKSIYMYESMLHMLLLVVYLLQPHLFGEHARCGASISERCTVHGFSSVLKTFLIVLLRN